jgi:hypothetical protein
MTEVRSGHNLKTLSSGALQRRSLPTFRRSLLSTSSLMMEAKAASTSETSVNLYQTTRRYIPEVTSPPHISLDDAMTHKATISNKLQQVIYAQYSSGVSYMEQRMCPSMMYSAFTDKVERSCDLPAPSRNCVTYRRAL